jgi:hypothetical protein
MMKRMWRRKLPDEPFMQQLSAMPSQLVFIMGCHRSGTSLLYHLLAYTGACKYISAYDIVKYDELLHNRRHGLEARVKEEIEKDIAVEKNRGLDNIPVGVDYPEEYRFLLKPKLRPWFFSMRKRIDALIFKPHLTPATLGRFMEICKKKQFLDPSDAPFVLKDPNDYYFNFRQVHELLPEAKMIFIHRHPVHILNSYMHGFGAIIETRNAYAALLDRQYRDLFRSPVRRRLFLRAFESEQVTKLMMEKLAGSYEYYMENIARMPADRFVSLRYEDLCVDPASHLLRIGKWLNIDMTPSIPKNFIAPRNLTILDRVQSAYEAQSERVQPYLKQQGYQRFPAAAASISRG